MRNTFGFGFSGGKGLAGSGGGFTPATVSGLVGWYYSESGITIATGVSQWDDLSGNGNHLTQSSAGLQPAYIAAFQNGKHAVRTDGSDDYMFCDALSSIMNGSDKAFSFVIAYKPQDLAGDQAIFSFGKSDVATQFSEVLTRGGDSSPATDGDLVTFKRDDVPASVTITSTGATIAASPSIIIGICHGTTVDIYVNKNTITAAGAFDVGTITVNQFTIGALRRTSISTLGAHNYLAMAFYNTDITEQNAFLVSDYFNNDLAIY